MINSFFKGDKDFEEVFWIFFYLIRGMKRVLERYICYIFRFLKIGGGEIKKERKISLN